MIERYFTRQTNQTNATIPNDRIIQNKINFYFSISGLEEARQNKPDKICKALYTRSDCSGTLATIQKEKIYFDKTIIQIETNTMT